MPIPDNKPEFSAKHKPAEKKKITLYSATAYAGPVCSNDAETELENEIRLYFLRRSYAYKKGDSEKTINASLKELARLGGIKHFRSSRTTLRDGYLYVYNEKTQLPEEYKISDGRLSEIKPEDGDIRTTECSDELEYLNYERGTVIYVAYSPVQWTTEYFGKVTDYRGSYMAKIQCDIIKDGKEPSKTGNIMTHRSFESVFATFEHGRDESLFEDAIVDSRDRYKDSKDKDKFKRDIFITIDDPIGRADDIAKQLNKEIKYLKEIIKQLSFEYYDEETYAKEMQAMFFIALTTYQAIYNEDNKDWKQNYGDLVDLDRLKKALGVKVRKDQRKKIRELQKDLKRVLGSDEYTNAYKDYLQVNPIAPYAAPESPPQSLYLTESMMYAKIDAMWYLSMLALNPHDIDRSLDLRHEYEVDNPKLIYKNAKERKGVGWWSKWDLINYSLKKNTKEPLYLLLNNTSLDFKGYGKDGTASLLSQFFLVKLNTYSTLVSLNYKGGSSTELNGLKNQSMQFYINTQNIVDVEFKGNKYIFKINKAAKEIAELSKSDYFKGVPRLFATFNAALSYCVLANDPTSKNTVEATKHTMYLAESASKFIREFSDTKSIANWRQITKATRFAAVGLNAFSSFWDALDCLKNRDQDAGLLFIGAGTFYLIGSGLAIMGEASIAGPVGWIALGLSFLAILLMDGPIESYFKKFPFRLKKKRVELLNYKNVGSFNKQLYKEVELEYKEGDVEFDKSNYFQIYAAALADIIAGVSVKVYPQYITYDPQDGNTTRVYKKKYDKNEGVCHFTTRYDGICTLFIVEVKFTNFFNIKKEFESSTNYYGKSTSKQLKVEKTIDPPKVEIQFSTDSERAKSSEIDWRILLADDKYYPYTIGSNKQYLAIVISTDVKLIEKGKKKYYIDENGKKRDKDENSNKHENDPYEVESYELKLKTLTRRNMFQRLDSNYDEKWDSSYPEPKLKFKKDSIAQGLYLALTIDNRLIVCQNSSPHISFTIE